MNEPSTPTSQPTSGPTPSSPVGGEIRPLDRAPGERYTLDTSGGRPTENPARRVNAKAIAVAVLVADAGAVLFFVLGLLDLGLGLIILAAFIGWCIALALVWRGPAAAIPDGRLRVAVAAFLGGWAVAGGILLDWIYALLEGGVLGPLDYVIERYGLVALLALVAGAAVAAFRAR